jgi:hypothetical protein
LYTNSIEDTSEINYLIDLLLQELQILANKRICNLLIRLVVFTMTINNLY